MNELDSLLTAIKAITDIDEASLTDEVLKSIADNLDEQFSPQLVLQSVNQIVKNLEDQGLTKEEAAVSMKAVADTLREMVYADHEYTGNKKVLVDMVLERMFQIFDEAAKKYHSYSIELPMTVSSNAVPPSYAHDTDAAADLYAIEDQVIPAHSYGNMIHTGIKIQLPEGWQALILPRSSMGLKTPLRLSNSVGLIDSSYRGELGVLYDNTSDEDYTIRAHDRIAQLLVMPNYRFQAKVVDILASSDRNDGGFGSTGT